MDKDEFKKLFTDIFEAQPKERSVKIYTNEMGYRMFDAALKYEVNPSPENKYYLDNIHEIVRKEIEANHNANMTYFIGKYGLEDYDFISAYLTNNKYWLNGNKDGYVSTDLYTEMAEEYERLYHSIIYRRGSFLHVTTSDYGEEIVKEICSKNRVVELLKQHE